MTIDISISTETRQAHISAVEDILHRCWPASVAGLSPLRAVRRVAAEERCAESVRLSALKALHDTRRGGELPAEWVGKALELVIKNQLVWYVGCSTRVDGDGSYWVGSRTRGEMEFPNAMIDEEFVLGLFDSAEEAESALSALALAQR